MESRSLSDLSPVEGRYPATRPSLLGEPLSVHQPSKLSTRYRELSDPLQGEVAAQAQAVKLRAPGLSPGGKRYRLPDLRLGSSALALRCRYRLDREMTLHGGETGCVADVSQLMPQPSSSPQKGAMLPTEAMEPCLDASRRSSEAATWAYEAIRRLKPTPRQRKDQAAMLPYTTAALTQSLLARCDVARRFEIRTAQNDEWQQAENPSSEREEYGENPPLDMPPVENLKRNRQAKPALTDGSYLWWIHHPPAGLRLLRANHAKLRLKAVAKTVRTSRRE